MRSGRGGGRAPGAGDRRRLVAGSVFQRVEQLGDLVVLLQGVPERLVLGNGVVVAPTTPLPQQVAVDLEVDHDLHGGPLGDTDEVGDLAEPEIRCLGDGQEHMGVVGQEGPGARRGLVVSHVRHGGEDSPGRADFLEI